MSGATAVLASVRPGLRGRVVRLLFVVALAAVVCGVAAGAEARPGTWAERRPAGFAELQAGFAQPDMRYAPFVFWFWDQPLEPARMAEMARRLAGQRLNPGYAHARSTGPGVTPLNPLPPDQWLSPLWFEAFKAALGEAVAQGTFLGYCDEYMWPSFQAAGRIAAQHPELRAASLDWVTHDVAGGTGVEVPACFCAVAARLAEPLAVEARPAEPVLGAWIWKPLPGTGPHTCCLRQTFEVPADTTVRRAAVRLSVDNRYTLYVNGREIGTGDDWRAVRTWNVTPALRPGRNVVAVLGGGDGGLDALSLGLRAELADGRVVDVRSAGTWRVAEKPVDGWTDPGFDDTAWPTARVQESDSEAAPWNLSATARGPHRPALIDSATLTVVSRGEPLAWQCPAAGAWRLYVFRLRRHGTVNYLDERLPGVFLPIAHEPYAAALGPALGTAVPGVFVDNEGGYGPLLAWSDTLDRRYRERWGRDIRLWLPLLLDRDRAGTFARARWEWFEVVSDLYAETMGSTSRWLAERGLYAISNLWEESLQWQAQYVGDFLKLTRAYSLPGNDCLGRKALEVHDFKEVESVSEFEGRRFMSEIMGAGGWDPFTPEFIKQATNAVTAWGVSHVVPHGVFTNRHLDGAQWTPDWYDANPMFPYLHLWSDFVRRASYVNAHGRAAADVLLLNPMDSVWATVPAGVFDPAVDGDLGATDARFGERIAQINAVYSRAIDDLTRHRVEFLVTDRYYLRQMRVDGPALVRGEFRFAAVVLPPVDVLPLDVVRTILEFGRAGGQVYALGELPTGSTDAGLGDPRMAEAVQALQALPGFHACPQGLEPELARNVPPLVSHIRFDSKPFPLLQRHVRLDGRDLFWLASNRDEWQVAEVTLLGLHGGTAVWDCETGLVRPAPATLGPDGLSLALHFRPYEGYWLAVDPAAVPTPPPATAEPAGVLLSLDGPWLVRLPADAQPVLEHPAEVPAEFRDGVRKPLEPWEVWGLASFSGVLDYQATFEIAAVPSGPTFLDLGTVLYVADVRLNGQNVGARLWPPHAVDVTAALRPGRNDLVVRVANLVNNSYGDLRTSGLLGPVALCLGDPHRLLPGALAGPALEVAAGEPVDLANPTADHSQPGYPVADALVDDERGWGAYDPAVREPVAQTLVVETVADVGRAGQVTELVFTLAHRYAPPEGLSLGRFRLSATRDPRAEFADGRDSGGDVATTWLVLRPERVAGSHRTVLTVQPDGSVLAAYGRSTRETYTVVCRTDLAGITGFRLEALEDPRLPRRPGGTTEGGPGRSPGEGNFVLTYLGVTARAVPPP